MKNITKIALLCFVVVSGILLFQAQDFNSYKFNDNDPMLDRPTREAFSHFDAMYDDNEQDVITDASGFDNYDIGIDFAEQYVTSNPLVPNQIFVSANGSPQNARNTMNGGLTWTLFQPSYPSGTCCDPWGAYLANGKLIYGSGVSGQYVYTSTNNGNTWTSPVLSVSGVDRNTLAAEVTGTGPFANYLYAAITSNSSIANFGRSTDQGVTWATTFNSAPQGAPGVMIAVGPNGATNGGTCILVTTTGSAGAAQYTFWRSTDGGLTFSNMSTLNVAGYSGTLNAVGRLVINNARHRTYPMIAMDNSNGPFRGRLYLAYSSNEPAGNGNKPDIKLQYSTDQGATWSAYVRVNDDVNPQNNDSWFPMITCERNTGKLYVKWYDDRENPASYTTGVWATYSTTGGVSFAPNQRISNASWTYPCPACGANQNCYRGDYDGITANPKVGFAAWWDARNCNYQTMGSYFPDFALKTSTTDIGVNGTNDSAFFFVTIPAVKLYTDTAQFTASVNPPPGTGSFTFTFLNKTTPATQNNITTFPDSIRLRIKTAGGVPTGNYTLTIQGAGPNGTPVHVRNVNINVGFVGLHNNNSQVPEKFYLYQNYPNPFNPNTNIRFDIVKTGLVKLTIYDVTGKSVNTLVNSPLTPGSYTYDFRASELASGIYFYKIEAPDFVSIRKMILVK